MRTSRHGPAFASVFEVEDGGKDEGKEEVT